MMITRLGVPVIPPVTNFFFGCHETVELRKRREAV